MLCKMHDTRNSNEEGILNKYLISIINIEEWKCDVYRIK
jgi:hypothetical protein